MAPAGPTTAAGPQPIELDEPFAPLKQRPWKAVEKREQGQGAGQYNPNAYAEGDWAYKSRTVLFNIAWAFIIPGLLHYLVTAAWANDKSWNRYVQANNIAYKHKSGWAFFLLASTFDRMSIVFGFTLAFALAYQLATILPAMGAMFGAGALDVLLLCGVVTAIAMLPSIVSKIRAALAERAARAEARAAGVERTDREQNRAENTLMGVTLLLPFLLYAMASTSFLPFNFTATMGIFIFSAMAAMTTAYKNGAIGGAAASFVEGVSRADRFQTKPNHLYGEKARPWSRFEKGLFLASVALSLMGGIAFAGLFDGLALNFLVFMAEEFGGASILQEGMKASALLTTLSGIGGFMVASAIMFSMVYVFYSLIGADRIRELFGVDKRWEKIKEFASKTLEANKLMAEKSRTELKNATDWLDGQGLDERGRNKPFPTGKLFQLISSVLASAAAATMLALVQLPSWVAVSLVAGLPFMLAAAYQSFGTLGKFWVNQAIKTAAIGGVFYLLLGKSVHLAASWGAGAWTAAIALAGYLTVSLLIDLYSKTHKQRPWNESLGYSKGTTLLGDFNTVSRLIIAPTLVSVNLFFICQAAFSANESSIAMNNMLIPFFRTDIGLTILAACAGFCMAFFYITQSFAAWNRILNTNGLDGDKASPVRDELAYLEVGKRVVNAQGDIVDKAINAELEEGEQRRWVMVLPQVGDKRAIPRAVAKVMKGMPAADEAARAGNAGLNSLTAGTLITEGLGAATNFAESAAVIATGGLIIGTGMAGSLAAGKKPMDETLPQPGLFMGQNTMNQKSEVLRGGVDPQLFEVMKRMLKLQYAVSSIEKAGHFTRNLGDAILYNPEKLNTEFMVFAPKRTGDGQDWDWKPLDHGVGRSEYPPRLTSPNGTTPSKLKTVPLQETRRLKCHYAEDRMSSGDYLFFEDDNGEGESPFKFYQEVVKQRSNSRADQKEAGQPPAALQEGDKVAMLPRYPVYNHLRRASTRLLRLVTDMDHATDALVRGDVSQQEQKPLIQGSSQAHTELLHSHFQFWTMMSAMPTSSRKVNQAIQASLSQLNAELNPEHAARTPRGQGTSTGSHFPFDAQDTGRGRRTAGH